MNRPALLSTLVCFLTLSSHAVFGHSAIESAPRTDEWWKKRQEVLNQRVVEQGSKAQVLFIGDSITQGWESEGKEVWDRFYTRRNAINLGIGGDRTQHVLWRLENGNLKGVQPKAAVVMIGTNNSNGEDNSVEQIADGVTAIVKKLRSTLPNTQVLLLAIFPRGENPNAQRGKVLQVNQILSKLASDPVVTWIDFGGRFLDSAGRIPRELMPDYLHLSPQAYQIWADALEPHLVRILGGAATAEASSASAAVVLSGKWTFTTAGPDGNPVSFPLELQQAGSVLTGRFSRGGDRWMPLQNGKVEGKNVSWTVQRDRPDGTSMTYHMKGSLTGGSLTGETRTDFNGSEVNSPWSAKKD